MRHLNSLADDQLSQVQILETRLTPLDLDATVALALKLVAQATASYLCIANAYTATLTVRDEHFRKASNGAAAVVADGMPLIWWLRAAGYSQVGRVYGADLVAAVCAAGRSQGIRHGFLGGFSGVPDRMIANLHQAFPGLQVAGSWDPGVIAPGAMTPLSELNAINQAAPDILWVGLGAPKQELWMAQHRPHLKAPLLIGVGQAFDLLAGQHTRSPGWMSTCGLEWLYRLCQEPKRLWKRYTIYNGLFLWYLVQDLIMHQPAIQGGIIEGDHTSNRLK